MINQTIIVDVIQAGFNVQKYNECLEEHRGKNTLIFISELWVGCAYGPAIVFPDDTTRWFEMGEECRPSDWADWSKAFHEDLWNEDFEKHYALLLLKYTECPQPQRSTSLDKVLGQAIWEAEN